MDRWDLGLRAWEGSVVQGQMRRRITGASTRLSRYCPAHSLARALPGSSSSYDSGQSTKAESRLKQGAEIYRRVFGRLRRDVSRDDGAMGLSWQY